MTQTTRTPRAGTPSASSEPTTKATRVLLACGVVAGPFFIVVGLIQMLTRDGFDLRRHALSMLSLGDLGWIQISNFVASGLLAVAFAIGMRRVLHPGRGGTWGPLLIGTYGLGLIVAGVFVPDPALGFPPGAREGIPETLSLSAVLHGVGFVLAFGSLTVACFLLARRYAALRQRGWAAYSVATAVVAFALSMWPSQAGASVRYFVAAVVVWAWTSVLAARLLADHSRQKPTAATD